MIGDGSRSDADTVLCEIVLPFLLFACFVFCCFFFLFVYLGLVLFNLVSVYRLEASKVPEC